MERRLEQTGAEEAVDSEHQGRAWPFLSLTSIKFLLTAIDLNSLCVTGAELAGLVQPGKEWDLLKFNKGAN